MAEAADGGIAILDQHVQNVIRVKNLQLGSAGAHLPWGQQEGGAIAAARPQTHFHLQWAQLSWNMFTAN